MLIRIEAHEDKEYGALLLKLRGLEPKGGLGPIDINHHDICNLYCKIGKGRNRARHMYEPASGFCRPSGVNHVYNGTTRRRFRDKKQQLEN